MSFCRIFANTVTTAPMNATMNECCMRLISCTLSSPLAVERKETCLLISAFFSDRRRRTFCEDLSFEYDGKKRLSSSIGGHTGTEANGVARESEAEIGTEDKMCDSVDTFSAEDGVILDPRCVERVGET